MPRNSFACISITAGVTASPTSLKTKRGSKNSESLLMYNSMKLSSNIQKSCVQKKTLKLQRYLERVIL
jgi:hypothetical protein